MKPGTFDDLTCRELAGDQRARLLEADGRALAEADEPPVRPPAAGSYWQQVQQEAEYRVVLAAYEKRRARMLRMQENHTP